ncbi:MAG: hypothetical protein M3R16_06505 [Pseudomonadota bacterium]|nr:hypothetical protein [Pseudomonadota bacterium]
MKTKMRIILIGLTMGLAAASAHSEASPPRAAATLEGTWRVEITLRRCDNWAAIGQPFPALASFDSAGTVVTSDGGMSPAARGTGHGVWSRVSGRDFSATTEAFLFNGGMRTGTQQLAQEIALENDGQTFESIVVAKVLNTTGQTVFSGCASSVGRRMH